MKSFLEKNCSKEWMDFINFHKKELRFDKSEFIFIAGAPTEGLFIIDEGKVKVSYQEYDGSSRLIRLAKDGDILGHRGFGGNWTYPISAYTLVPTIVSFIPVNIFHAIAKVNPTLTYNLMMFFTEELRKSEAKLKRYPVINLVARVLLDNYRAFGFESDNSLKLSYTLSRKDIANKAGITYETVVRTLANFNKTGIIKIEGKSIHILNMAELVNLARPDRVK